MVVDLEVSQHQPARRLIESERLLVAQHVPVELAGGRQIVRLQADMRDSDDWRTLLRPTGQNCQKNCGDEITHVASSTTFRRRNQTDFRRANSMALQVLSTEQIL